MLTESQCGKVPSLVSLFFISGHLEVSNLYFRLVSCVASEASHGPACLNPALLTNRYCIFMVMQIERLVNNPLLEKVTATQVVKIFSTFHGT
jgi:hypothetical protein